MAVGFEIREPCKSDEPAVPEHPVDDFPEQFPVEIPSSDHFDEILRETPLMLRCQCSEPRLQGRMFDIRGEQSVVGNVIDMAAPVAEEQGIAPTIAFQQ